MKNLICSIIILFSSFICFGQLPTEVKHVEIVSEIKDTMILLNKPDVDKINTVFYRLDYADSLNIVNEAIITSLNTENSKLENIISEQKLILSNKDVQISNIKEKNKEVISDLEKQVKRTNRKSMFWESTTGLSVICIILLAIF